MMEHRIVTKEDESNIERSYWECSCGTSGSCPSYNADIASDRHIRYDLNETRVDTNRLGPWDDLY